MKPKAYQVEKTDIVALFFIFAGLFVLSRIGIIGLFNIGFSIGCAILLIISFIYLWKKEATSKFFSIVLLVLGLLLVSSFSLSADNLIKFCTMVYLPFYATFLMCNVSGNVNLKNGTYKCFINSISKTLDGAFLKLDVTLKSYVEKLSKNKSKNTVYVIAGIAISIPLLCIVLPLLSSSDIAFASMVKSIFKNAGLLLLSLIVTVIIFPTVYSYNFSMKKQQAEEAVNKKATGKLPNIIFNIVLGAVSFVYCAYAVSQLAYITKAFAFLLPEDFTAAEFARSGFFQMGVISFINFLILGLTAMLVKRKGKKIPTSTKALLGFVCLFTVFYISTAIIKMLKYISLYGLTHLRVLTSVFMLMLGLIFVVLLFRLFTPKIKYVKAIVIICTVALLCVSVVDTKTVIAEYNYKQYKERKIDIDVEQIGSLGVSGIPTLIKLVECDDEEVASAAEDELYEAYVSVYERYALPYDSSERKIVPIKNDFYEKNLSWIKAKEVLDEYTKSNPQVYEQFFYDAVDMYVEDFNEVV